MYTGLHVKYPLFLSELSGKILEKSSNIKFYINSFSGSEFYGRTVTQTNVNDEDNSRFP